MKILMTGGSGDLGSVLAPLLAARGDVPVSFDVQPPRHPDSIYRQGSILDLERLNESMQDIDLVVHIAAWHGIHQVRGEKDVFDFWNLNVTGTFYVLETAVKNGIKQVVYISSSSIDEWPDIYGSSKVLAEELTRTYARRHGCSIINLRPRAFIPHWNRETYRDFVEWARWFWPGAVHIDDVAQAVIKSIDLVATTTVPSPLTLVVDGAYDYSDDDIRLWDAEGPGTTFDRVYPGYRELVKQVGLDPTIKPNILNIKQTREWLDYQPDYSLKNLLQELETYGREGPPHQFSSK